MSERFFSITPITSDRATLEGPEAHHLARVLRAQVGDVVTLFDGSGWEFIARIEAISKSQIQFTVQPRRELNREAAVPLTLAAALPKGDRQRWLVEKAVELGVAALAPLETERGVAQPSESALERLRRAVVEASKQCGRNRLMEITPAKSWKACTTWQENTWRILAHPGGLPLAQVGPADAASLFTRGILAAIGPEGGFTDNEVAAALAAGWQAVDLGPRILRVETAAVAIAAWAAMFAGAND